MQLAFLLVNFASDVFALSRQLLRALLAWPTPPALNTLPGAAA
jgi:hypothetical protein